MYTAHMEGLSKWHLCRGGQALCGADPNAPEFRHATQPREVTCHSCLQLVYLETAVPAEAGPAALPAQEPEPSFA